MASYLLLSVQERERGSERGKNGLLSHTLYSMMGWRVTVGGSISASLTVPLKQGWMSDQSWDLTYTNTQTHTKKRTNYKPKTVQNSCCDNNPKPLKKNDHFESLQQQKKSLVIIRLCTHLHKLTQNNVWNTDCSVRVQHNSMTMTTVVLLIVFFEALCWARSTCSLFPTLLIISLKCQYGVTSTHRQEVYL